MSVDNFLPGVPSEYVLDRLAKAGGNEVESGKLVSVESSAALAVNTFAWFHEQPEAFPHFPGLEGIGTARRVDVEHCARFPWSGGRHPWLDAMVETDGGLIGIESKRFEPYRDTKGVSLSEAYDRPVWGTNMESYERMRDALRSGSERFTYLDAAQLVKHAFGLVTDGRRKGKAPILIYLFAEPAALQGRPLDPSGFSKHRAEILRFAKAVAGAEVVFHFISYREWLAAWPTNGPISEHAKAIVERFDP